MPPTYFVAQHAMLLVDRAQFSFFARSASVEGALPGPLSVPPATSPPRGLRMLLAFASAPWVAFSICRFHPDVIHQHFATWAGPALWASRILRVPLFVTLHGYDVLMRRPNNLRERVRTAWHRRALRQLVAHGAQFLAVSDFLRQEAVFAGVPTERVMSLPLGVDTDVFSPGDRNPAESLTGRKVVFVGRLARQKGGDDLIRAVSNIRYPYRLEIIGEGPERDSWLELSQSLGVDVSFLGRLHQSEVRDQLRTAAVLVLPTQEDLGCREAAGLTLMEAQACGVPVIAYASGGTPEMLINGRTGRLVPEGDVTGLKRAIDEIMDLDEKAYLQLGVEARGYAETSGNSRSAALALLAHYESAIESHSTIT